MSEIEKVFENAGIKPTKNWQSCLNCKLKTEKLYDDWGEEYFTCIMLECPEKCPNAKKFYPLFTAEKQIELIKWLAVKGDFDSSIDIAKNTYDYWTIYFQGARWTAEGFEESLAGLINILWQDLTEEEKQQVKGILE